MVKSSLFPILLLPILLGFVFSSVVHGQPGVKSPDGKIEVIVTAQQGSLVLQASCDGRPILSPSRIGLDIRGRKLAWKVVRKSIVERDETIQPPVREKRRILRDHFRQLDLVLSDGISLHVRVYDDGFAYRFATNFRDSITIQSEVAQYAIPEKTTFVGAYVRKREDADVFHTSFEEPYSTFSTDSIPADHLFFSPVLVAYPDNMKVVITESDLEDFPGMFLRFSKPRMIEGVNAAAAAEVNMMQGHFPQEIVTRRADFIARTAGRRTYPWRAFLVSRRDTELPSNDMVYRLGSPSRVKDTSWLRPGKGTDEWIIGINLFNVPFKAGVNTETYKYYIDFAKRFGFQRIMMDAGWSESTDLFKINPDIDMDAIAAHARQQGISLSMWTLASTLDRQLEPALRQFNKWGVDFIMTDFMDRDDQDMVNFYHRVAKACADHQIMIMFHGAFKPAGFSRTWPNAVTREGVLGSEYNIWSDKAHPDHDLLLPFIRMTAGPMDYEPGILDNATLATFRPISEKVMSMGTRMHQAAMFVVYESPIQLFSGNPSQGLMEPEFMELVGSIPTTWDETMVVDGKLGEFIVTARKSGSDWFVGGMSNWQSREIVLPLSFLDDGEYEVLMATDGVNADRYPSDYIISRRVVKKGDLLRINIAKGGGFVLRVKKK